MNNTERPVKVLNEEQRDRLREGQEVTSERYVPWLGKTQEVIVTPVRGRRTGRIVRYNVRVRD